MRRNTAKLFFVVCMLLQGSNSTRAAENLFTKLISSPHPSIRSDFQSNDTSQMKSPWLLKPSKKKEQAFQIAKDNRKARQFPSKAKNLQSKVSELKGPEDLSLPSKASEIRVKDQYKLAITDLERLIEENSPKLEIYRRQVEQEKYNLRQTVSSWYPTLDLSASPQYLDANNYYNSRTNTSSDRWQTTLSAEINWNLVDPGRSPEIAAAKDKYEQARTKYLIQARDIKLDAVNTYFTLQNSDEGVRIGQESVKASEISLYDAKSRFESGLGTRLEVLEAETQLARDRKLLTQKLGEQNINRSELRSILNLPPSIQPIASSPSRIIGIWDSSLEQSILSAYSFQKELDNIRLDISINNSNANLSLASAQPTISIFNTLSNSYSDGKLASADQDGSSISNTVGLKATWRIFDGNKAISGYNYNKQIAKVAEARFANERNNIRKEVEKDFFDLRTAKQDIASSTREVIAARESLRLARLRFKAGIATQREVVNNQRDLTQAEVGYSEALMNYNKSITKLQRKTGLEYKKACHPPTITSRSPNDTSMNNMNIDSLSLIKSCQ